MKAPIRSTKNRKFAIKSYAIRGVDGNEVRLSETFDGREVVLSIQQNDNKGQLACIRLNYQQYGELFDLRFKLEIEDAYEDETAQRPDLVAG